MLLYTVVNSLKFPSLAEYIHDNGMGWGGACPALVNRLLFLEKYVVFVILCEKPLFY